VGIGTEAVGMGTVFMVTVGDGVQCLSLCRPLVHSLCLDFFVSVRFICLNVSIILYYLCMHVVLL